MCGITGLVAENIQRFTGFEKAISSLFHRGPDGQGEQLQQICGKTVWLAHTRLAILDLSQAGNQPMQSKDERWLISFNGEIYNHLELRASLPGPFRGHSDTETLVELIAAQGIDAVLPQLNGMFAFAALDTKDGKLFLVRDPFGIKPIYYVCEDSHFAFASEARALRALGLSESMPNEKTLQLFLTLRYVPSPWTLRRDVKRLQPGHFLCLDLTTEDLLIRNFAKPVCTRFTGSIDDAVTQYKEEFRNAVKRQLLSDVPVGILLSGGIDSALIAAMAKDAGHDLPCFTVGFGKEHEECEIAEAEKTAKVLGLPISSVVVTPEMLLDVLPEIVRAVEEPLGTTSIMPMWYLVKRAREDVTVVLTGQGTDEPWGGYQRYQMEMVRRLMPWSGFWRMLASAGSIVDRRLPEVFVRGLRSLKVAEFTQRILEACALFPAEERVLITGSHDDGGAVDAINEWINWMAEAQCGQAESMMRIDTRMNLADDLLLYGDKISMAFSLEARVPMLDVELMRFVESLPLRFRMALCRTKIVHKLMAEQYLPKSIIQRKKKGFQVPFGAWSRAAWKPYIEDTLLSADAPHWAILNRNGVMQFWAEHLEAKPDRSRQIFALLMFAIWYQQQ